MRTFPNNLRNSYYSLKKSRLYTKGEIDDDALSFFEYMVNKSLPTNELDNNKYYFIKSLFYSDKQKFYNFIDNSPRECLILYTDNVSILRHFNLLKKVNLKWDPEKKKYLCSKFNTENTIDDIENESNYLQLNHEILPETVDDNQYLDYIDISMQDITENNSDLNLRLKYL